MAISSLTVFVVLLLASPALAMPSAPTRADYKKAVEPICRSESNTNRKLLRGVEGMVARGKLKEVAPRVFRAGEVLRAMAKKLAAVPRPPADVERLTRWLGFSRSGGALLSEIGLALRREKRSRAEILSREMLVEMRRANATVAGFNFDYCRIRPARFV